MADRKMMGHQDTDLGFLEEREDAVESVAGDPWKILVVDDEPDVHVVTRAVLRGCRFFNRPITIMEANTAASAQRLLAAHSDIAVAILDVVMECDDAGLELVGVIRNRLDRRALRIIMRTGQPGYAPERDVIERYDINDYRLKSDLTAATLYTSVIVALRGYHEIACRILAEEALRQAKEGAEQAEIRSKIEERRFRDFAEASADLFWETNENMYVTFFSRYETFIDASTTNATVPFELSQLELIVHPDRRENWIIILDALKNRKPFRAIEISLRNLAGNQRFFSFTGVSCFDDAGNYYGHRGTATDVTERRRSEIALRAQEKAEAAEAVAIAEQRRFQDFAASSADWYWEGDKFGRVSYHFHNQGTAGRQAVFVKTLEEFFRKRNEGISAHNRDFWQQYHYLMESRRPFRDLEFALDASDNTRRYLTVSGVPANDQNGHYVGYRGTTREITARKEAEVELRESKERIEALSHRLTQIMASSSTTTYVIEPYLAKRQNIFITDNVFKLVGYDTKQFSLFPEFWLRNIHTDDIHRVLKDFAILLKYGRLDCEYRFRHSEGHWVWLRDSQTLVCNDAGDPVEIVGALSDITARRTAEEALGAKNDDLQRTLADLRQTQAQLVHAEKMTALGQLVAGVAHEINNPLGFVIGNLESLLELVKDVEEAYRQLDKAALASAMPAVSEKIREIRANCCIDDVFEDIGQLLPASLGGLERISQIIKHLRLFSRLDSGESGVENLEKLIFANLELVKRQLGDKNIKIVTKFSNMPQAKCYAGEMNQVFMNLIVNAEQAMPEGGVLTITGCSERGGKVRIEFRDTGCGIPKGIIEKIFEPFFTTKPIGKGTGLGLSISYGIITNRHNGRIFVQSEVGNGTVFTIIIPCNLGE